MTPEYIAACVRKCGDDIRTDTTQQSQDINDTYVTSYLKDMYYYATDTVKARIMKGLACYPANPGLACGNFKCPDTVLTIAQSRMTTQTKIKFRTPPIKPADTNDYYTDHKQPHINLFGCLRDISKDPDV